MMFRLAHISDVHLGPLPPVLRRELVSKRITGYINWRRNRATHHDAATVSALVSHMEQHHPDHLAITGDLVNLGLDAEIETVRVWLETLGDPAAISVVCGNHDAYVPGSLTKAFDRWQEWIAGDNGRRVAGRRDFPVLRRRGRVSIIGCNSARASMPFMATGYFYGQQANALEKLLEEEGRRGQCRVVLIHHPPVRGATYYHKRLIGAGRFRRVIAAKGAELVLHGHTHLDSIAAMAGPAGTEVPVIGVPSAGEAGGRARPAARYNLFDIDEGPKGWSIAMQEFGLTGPASPVELISERTLD